MDPFFDYETGDGLAPGWSLGSIFDEGIDRFDVEYFDGVPPLTGLPPAFSCTPSMCFRVFFCLAFMFAFFKSPTGQQAAAAVPPTVTLLGRVGFVLADGLYTNTKDAVQNAWPPGLISDRRELYKLRGRLPALEVQAQQLRMLVPELDDLRGQVPVLEEMLEGLRAKVPVMEEELERLRGRVPLLQGEVSELRANISSLLIELKELRPLRSQTASLEEELTRTRKLNELHRNHMLMLEDKVAKVESAYGELLSNKTRQTWPMAVAETVLAVMHPAVLIASKSHDERAFLRTVSTAARELDMAAQQAMATVREEAEVKTQLEERVKQLLLEREHLEEEAQAKDRALMAKDDEVAALRDQLARQQQEAVEWEAKHRSTLEAKSEAEHQLAACAGVIEARKTRLAPAEGTDKVVLLESAVAEPPVVVSRMEGEEQEEVGVNQQALDSVACTACGGKGVAEGGNDTKASAPSPAALDLQHAELLCHEELAQSRNVTDIFKCRAQVLEGEVEDMRLQREEAISHSIQVVATLLNQSTEAYPALVDVVGDCTRVLGAQGAPVEAALQLVADLQEGASLIIRELPTLLMGTAGGANHTELAAPSTAAVDLQHGNGTCEEELVQSEVLTANYRARVDLLEEHVQSRRRDYQRFKSSSNDLLMALLYNITTAYGKLAEALVDCQAAVGGDDDGVEETVLFCHGRQNDANFLIHTFQQGLEGAE